MLFNNVFFCFLSVSLILAHPLMERREDNNAIVLARAVKVPTKAPAKASPKVPAKASSKGPTKTPPKAPGNNKSAAKPPPGMKLYTGTGVVEQARKANNAPGRQVPKVCKKAADCSCPKVPNSNTFQSTSCINGSCSCNNPAVNLLAKESVKAVKEFGNAPVTKGIATTFKTLSDIVQVAGTVVGTVLGPVGRFAVKGALKAMPDMGPSHIDDATKGVFGKLS